MRRKTKTVEPLQAGLTDGHSAASEAYRTLRTNIQFMTLDKPTKSLLIVGVHPGCGKTTTATNLGVTLAQAGSKVLLVDSDLRRPKLHSIFNCNNYSGLTTLLIEENFNLKAVSHKTRFENLDLVPGGPVPPNSAELLASLKMQKILTELKNIYDYVILDSPPMLNMADASILSSFADATLLVVAYGETTREETIKVHQQLQMAKANLIGVVINGIPPHLNPYGYYGYYHEEPQYKKKRKKKKKKQHYDEDSTYEGSFKANENFPDF